MPLCFWIAAAAPGDRYEIRVKYFQPMCFNARKGCCFLELPTCMPQVRVRLRLLCGKSGLKFLLRRTMHQIAVYVGLNCAAISVSLKCEALSLSLLLLVCRNM